MSLPIQVVLVSGSDRPRLGGQNVSYRSNMQTLMPYTSHRGLHAESP